MPKGTRVDRCYQKLKKTKGKASAAAICQLSTKQSLKTGKSLNELSKSTLSTYKAAAIKDKRIRSMLKKDADKAWQGFQQVSQDKEWESGEHEKISDRISSISSRHDQKISNRMAGIKIAKEKLRKAMKEDALEERAKWRTSPARMKNPQWSGDPDQDDDNPGKWVSKADTNPEYGAISSRRGAHINTIGSNKGKVGKRSSGKLKDQIRASLQRGYSQAPLPEESMAIARLDEERKVTRQAVDAFYKRKDYKGKNTKVYTDEHGHTHMELHGNRIATHMKNGSIWTNHKGWPGPTTKGRTSGIAHRLGKGSYYTQKHELHNPSGKKIGSHQWDKLKEEKDMKEEDLDEARRARSKGLFRDSKGRMFYYDIYGYKRYRPDPNLSEEEKMKKEKELDEMYPFPTGKEAWDYAKEGGLHDWENIKAGLRGPFRKGAGEIGQRLSGAAKWAIDKVSAQKKAAEPPANKTHKRKAKTVKESKSWNLGGGKPNYNPNGGHEHIHQPGSKFGGNRKPNTGIPGHTPPKPTKPMWAPVHGPNKPPKPWKWNTVYHEEQEMDNINRSSGALNVLDSIVDQNALGLKNAFDEAMKEILPDYVDAAKQYLAQEVFAQPEISNLSDLSEEDFDAFVDSLSDEEIEAIINSDEEIPYEEDESVIEGALGHKGRPSLRHRKPKGDEERAYSVGGNTVRVSKTKDGKWKIKSRFAAGARAVTSFDNVKDAMDHARETFYAKRERLETEK